MYHKFIIYPLIDPSTRGCSRVTLDEPFSAVHQVTRLVASRDRESSSRAGIGMDCRANHGSDRAERLPQNSRRKTLTMLSNVERYQRIAPVYDLLDLPFERRRYQALRP